MRRHAFYSALGTALILLSGCGAESIGTLSQSIRHQGVSEAKHHKRVLS